MSLFKSILVLQMKIKFMYENNCPLVFFFCGWMESQKLKTQKLKCYVLRPKSQKFPTAENTRYTVFCTIPDILFSFPGQRESGILDPFFNICPNILHVDADADAGGIAIALLHESAGALKIPP